MSDVTAAARFVEHARRYSELGWALVRLDGKVPKGKDWQQERPGPSPEHVAGLWSQWGKRWNMGVVLGTSGLVVVEYDTDEAGTKLRELLGGELPLTPIAQTGRGRLHLYFKDAGLAKGQRDGLELRAGPHQCVLPPSVHPETGQAYRWMDKLEPWTVKLGDVPAAVLAYFTEPKARNGAAPPLPEVIRIGEIDRTLASLAGSMRRRNADEEAIYVALVETLKRCEPGHTHTETDCRRIARSIAKKAPGETTKVSIPPPIALESGGNESSEPAAFAPVPLEELLENVPPEPSWVLRGYLAAFALTLLAGRPKVGKSTAVFALVARLVAGEPFAGLETGPAGVLMLSEERRDTLAEKARILGLVSISPRTSPIGGGNETKRRPVHVLLRHDAGSLAWPELVRQAMSYCHQHDLGVLVVDTWDRWTNMRGDLENAAGAVNEALEPLQYAAASGIAVLIVSHQRKSLGEFGEAVRGSNALTGGVDVVVELERPAPSLKLSKHTRALRAVSRFSSTPDELYLELDEIAGTFVAIESPEEVKALAERERILEAVAALGGSASKEIAGEVELPDATVRRHLSALHELGHVSREGQGKRGDPYRWLPADEAE